MPLMVTIQPWSYHDCSEELTEHYIAFASIICIPWVVCKDLIHLITRWHQRWTNTSIQSIFQSMVSIIVYYNEIELTDIISHNLILSNGIPPLCFYYALIHKYPTSSMSSNSTLEVYAYMVVIYTYTHRHLCSQVRNPSPHQLSHTPEKIAD